MCQVEIDERLVKLVDFPNLLCDSGISWNVALEIDHRRASQFRSTTVGNHDYFSRLGLPVVPFGEGSHLILLGSGVYSFNRADTGLTATRELELRPIRY